MPRPKKPVDYAQELARIDLQITRWKNTIAELQEERKRLEAEQEKAALDALYRAVRASGKSIGEAIALIAGEQPQRLDDAS